MREIMISIQPQWVEKILNGKKTIEIRKTMPKCELPCKVYIYCTKAKNHFDTCVIHNKNKDEKDYSFCEIGNSKVVAEFILYDIETIERDFNDWLPKRMYDIMSSQLEASCLTEKELGNYGNGRVLYAWYIDDLKIYEKPKELSDFTHNVPDYSNGVVMYSLKPEPLKRPFQSWGYVNENN